MTDVGRLAGVSIMTVSRVLNDSGRVNQVTHGRVLAAMRQLDYRPNILARALVTGRARALGVVTLDTALYGPGATLFGIEQAARAADYSVSIVSLRNLDRSSIAGAVRTLQAQAVAGIIVIAPHASAAESLGRLPGDIILIAAGGDGGTAVSSVAVAQKSGAGRATEHLLSLGHETVYHVAGPVDWLEAQAREAGWREALEAADRPVHPSVHGDWTPASGYSIGLRLARQRGLTAVFVANDQMALGVLRALREAKVPVPYRVSVVGFDDVPEAAFFSPPLTTIRQDFGELGRRCFSALIARIEGISVSLDHVTIPAELVLRESSAARYDRGLKTRPKRHTSPQEKERRGKSSQC